MLISRRKQRQKMQEAQQSGYFVCDGTGFRGVQQIIDTAETTKGGWKKKKAE